MSSSLSASSLELVSVIEITVYENDQHDKSLEAAQTKALGILHMVE